MDQIENLCSGRSSMATSMALATRRRFTFLGLGLLLWGTDRPAGRLRSGTGWMCSSYVSDCCFWSVTMDQGDQARITYPRTGYAEVRTEYTIWSLVPGILGIIGLS